MIVWPESAGAVRKSQVDDTENTIRFTMPGQTDLLGLGRFHHKASMGQR